MKTIKKFQNGGKTPENPAPRLREDGVMGCAFGFYPWDGWEKHALAKGVASDLAALGRAVIREAWQHGWDERHRSLCGWRDDGRRMLRLALRNPALAEKRWDRLMETDGARYDPVTGEKFYPPPYLCL
jgi:hypothetical protein